jgi:hypothetical protein
MTARFRATVLVAFTLVSAALVCSSAALGDTPEWQRDLDYLTWDRRAEGANAAAGGPVYLQPEGQRTAAVSNVAPAPTWQLRVRDFYSIVTPRGLRSMWSRNDAPSDATATLTVPAPGLAVEQPVGAVARRNELPMHGSIVR